MASDRRWSEEDLKILREKWGEVKISNIAKKVGRSVRSVKQKAYKLGYVSDDKSLDGVTLSLIAKLMGMNNASGVIKRTWINKLHIPYKTKVYKNHYVRYIGINDFWKWAEQNKKELNFAKLEKNILGKEPEWMDAKRAYDKSTYKKHGIKWTKEQDDLLRFMLSRHKYTYQEISDRIGHSNQAIQRHIRRLGIMDRPIESKVNGRWNVKDLNYMIDILNQGGKLCDVAKVLHRSEMTLFAKLKYLQNCKILYKNNQNQYVFNACFVLFPYESYQTKEEYDDAMIDIISSLTGKYGITCYDPLTYVTDLTDSNAIKIQSTIMFLKSTAIILSPDWETSELCKKYFALAKERRWPIFLYQPQFRSINLYNEKNK